MADDLLLNVPLLRRRIPNLTVSARAVGLRSATVSDLCTGKIPVGRAEVRTLVALASLAGCSLDDLVLRGGVAGMIETGIKVLDLFAPLVRGGTVGLVAREGVGQMVVLAELLRGLRTHRDFFTMIWLPREPLPYADELLPQASATAATLEEVVAIVTEANVQHDVLIAADREIVLSGELLRLRDRLQEPGSRPLTFALFDSRGETPDVEGAPYGPLDVLWHFELELAARGLYPAVDALRSTSVLLEGAQLEAAHLSLAVRARALLRRYRELRTLVPVHGLERFALTEQTKCHRGERLEAFLTQPFFVAETSSKRPGVRVSLAETLDGVRRILDGGADNIDVEALRYAGSLTQIGRQ
jgi:F-type H+/Na+-transporting ATPase subunit beta